jgi:hypothetical protein
MPNNRVIYAGIVVLVVTVLIWIGAELTRRVEWILPYSGALGVFLVVVGAIYEIGSRRRRADR